jgi:hypothetical protein
VCVCYRGQNTVLSGSQRVLSAGCQEWGTKKENPGCLPAAAAAKAAAAEPGLIC